MLELPMTAATMTAPVAATAAAPVLDVAKLSNLPRTELAKMFVDRFGRPMPARWSRYVAAKAYIGTEFPAGPNGKACATWHYQQKAKAATGCEVVVPKDWTVDKLTAAAAAPTVVLPRGKSAPGGLTVAAARKLLTEAIRTGMLDASLAVGRSKWGGDTVKAFVLAHKLNAPKVAAAA
jgi:hypothetical protein